MSANACFDSYEGMFSMYSGVVSFQWLTIVGIDVDAIGEYLEKLDVASMRIW